MLEYVKVNIHVFSILNIKLLLSTPGGI